MTISNSTLSGNSASTSNPNVCPSGGGISGTSGAVTIDNSTISGNSASQHGQMGCPGVGGGIGIGTVTLQNTIVANNSVGGNCYIAPTSNGYNLSSDNTCNFNGPGDLNNTDPKLGPLQNNGWTRSWCVSSWSAGLRWRS